LGEKKIIASSHGTGKGNHGYKRTIEKHVFNKGKGDLEPKD